MFTLDSQKKFEMVFVLVIFVSNHQTLVQVLFAIGVDGSVTLRIHAQVNYFVQLSCAVTWDIFYSPSHYLGSFNGKNG